MDMRDTIRSELRKIVEKHHVRILYAAESGSRAWGFASPDSDYDVRFIYVRPAADYLRLKEPRDVIEWVNDGLLDINGWDLKKALAQFARGNATLYEWSHSPVVYATTPEWESVEHVSAAYFSEKAAIFHYYGTAMSTWSTSLTGKTVKYKKYFYALRPLLAANYIERYHQVPPVRFDDLMKMEMDAQLRATIEELLEIKKRTTEGEENPHMPVIRSFLEQELQRQRTLCSALPDDRNPDCTALDDCFVRLIGLDHVLAERQGS